MQPLSASEAQRTHIVLLRDNVSVLPDNTAPGSAAGTLGIPASGLPVPSPITILADFSSGSLLTLDLGFARNLWDLPAGVSEGHLQLQSLQLHGLAQGPEAAAARSLDAPEVWTVLLWAVRRCVMCKRRTCMCWLWQGLQHWKRSGLCYCTADPGRPCLLVLGPQVHSKQSGACRLHAEHAAARVSEAAADGSGRCRELCPQLARCGLQQLI